MTINAIAEGMTALEPIAAMQRKAMSTPTFGANPHAKDANAVTAKPPSQVRRCPQISDARPNAGTKTARNKNGAVTTHDTVERVVSNSSRMNGAAAVSAVIVSPVANNPEQTTSKIRHRCGFGSSVWRSDRSASVPVTRREPLHRLRATRASLDSASRGPSSGTDQAVRTSPRPETVALHVRAPKTTIR